SFTTLKPTMPQLNVHITSLPNATSSYSATVTSPSMYLGVFFLATPQRQHRGYEHHEAHDEQVHRQRVNLGVPHLGRDPGQVQESHAEDADDDGHRDERCEGHDQR